MQSPISSQERGLFVTMTVQSIGDIGARCAFWTMGASELAEIANHFGVHLDSKHRRNRCWH